MYKGIEVEVVNLKSLPGRNFDMVTCDIKYKGKKILTYQDDGNGGCPHLNVLGSLVKDGKGGWKKSPERIKNLELYEELTKRLQETEGAMGCVEDTMMGVVEHAQKLKDAKKGIVVRQKDETYTYSIIQFKAGSITAMLKKYGKHQVIPLLEQTMKKYQDQGGTILMQDYYTSIGVNPEIFTKS
jgi:hypothetical protein